MNRRMIEWMKTGLIAILLISALLLGYKSDVFTGLANALTDPKTAGSDPFISGLTPTEAARPGVIVLTNHNLERAVFKYDMDAIDLIYSRTSGSVGEALSALQNPAEASENEWRQALTSPGIMFEYFESMPLELVRDWLGASGEGYGVTVRRLCLVLGNGSSELYFEGGDAFYKCQTASLNTEFLVPAIYGESKYQFEQNLNSTAPYMILTDGSTHATALVSNPLTDTSMLISAVSVLGIDLRQTSSYPENDGARIVYVSGSFVISASADGVVTYHRTAENAAAVSASDTRDAVELARRTVASTIGALSGEARVYFTGYSYGNNAITVTFDYFFAGGRVFVTSGNAASVTVSGGVVTELSLCFRNYTSGEGQVLLPETQALAIGGEFLLGYADSPSASPFWYKYERGIA